ncbi:uncharacterized protein LOC121869357 [Homarus americanus]|uniref:uncharacterized protein LOC121869357 n=1 Tax=Homarus americanus TaxID=6706 RepID=UPI001C461C37|nr:uncharacterized protein LOC121869357 [Homarus americanus]XP_042226635.1 uncharacterized protein LOC121869357 [Homarus americanus]
MESQGGNYLFNNVDQQQPEWARDRPITFEDLGIPRSQSTRATVFGNIRTCQSLCLLEWVLLMGGLMSTLITIGLAVYRLFFLSPGTPDYVFAMLIIFHSGFCIIYILDGVFREQAFEILAFVASCAILIIYVLLNFVKESQSTSDVFKLVRLVLTLIFGSSLGVIGLILGYNYWQSENLIFRTVGADSTIQAMCRNLFTAITLILFDTQIVGSVVILSLHDGITKLDLEEIMILSVGPPLLLVWAIITYLALRVESSYLFTVAMMLSPCHVVFVLAAIIQTALNQDVNLIAQCRYAASSGSLLVHIVLIVFMIKCYRNFGLGLKEKVYPTQSSSITAQRSLVQ